MRQRWFRLATAVIAEHHDEWAVTDRRYLSESSMAKIYEPSQTGPKDRRPYNQAA
jgi:putative transposase